MTEVRDMWMAPCKPNGLQAAPDGLWVMAQSSRDQTDTHAYKLRYEDGSVIQKVPTGLGHAGGISEGGGHLWVTADSLLVKLDYAGNTVGRYMAPGGAGNHGVEWVDDHNMWTSDPLNFKVHLLDPTTMAVKRSVGYPVGKKGHGMFVHGGSIWQGITRKDIHGGEIYQIDADDGTVLRHIDIPDPEIHGFTQHHGLIWFCCARTHRVCTVPLPS